MKCLKCKKSGAFKVQNLVACRNCFLEIIEKRVRKELRINQLIEKNDKILIIDDDSKESKINMFLLKEIIKGLPVEISIKKMRFILGENIPGNYNKILVPWNADREGEYLLSCVLDNKKPKYLWHYKIMKKTYIKLLLPITSDELIIYAKIRGVKSKEEKKSEMIAMIQKLEKEYPETIFSLVKSAKEIKKFF
jgi:hypothetical protein